MKTLNNRDEADEAEAKAAVGDVVIFGNTDMWKLISKASSKKEGWMKSTKAMELPEAGGVLVQVTTQQGDHVAEALAFCPDAMLVEIGEQDDKTLWEIQ